MTTRFASGRPGTFLVIAHTIAFVVLQPPIAVVWAAEETEKPVTLPGITVLETRDKEYHAPSAGTATKTDTPIMETPLSIQVVPRAVIDDQQAIRLDDVAKNVSGVQRQGTIPYDDLIIRGFSTQATVYRNGFRLFLPAVETAHLERVEVLKGPASVLYGRIEPGGLVNLITKGPLTEPYYSLQQQAGSYNFYRTTADATGPITDGRSLLYRLNLAYVNAGSFRDFVDNKRAFVSPVLTWRPVDDTEFNLALEYKHEDLVDDYGIPAIGNSPAPVPISRFTSEPEQNDHTNATLIDFNWSHRFTDGWTLRNGGVVYLVDWSFEDIPPTFLLADNRTQRRGAFFVDADRNSYAAFLDLTGRFRVVGMDHSVLLGADYYRRDLEDGGLFAATRPAIRSSLDIFNPLYGQVDFAALRAMKASDPNFFSTSRDRWYGVYSQDQIAVWDKVHFLIGGRYDWARASTGFSGTSFASIQEQKVDTQRFSPRVGLVYQPWSWLSLYGNYVKSLGGANTGQSATGQPFDPERGRQYEAGVKTDLLGGRLGSTLAFYHLTKSNVLTADPNNPEGGFQRAIGEARSRGIELDIAGRVTDALSLVATYAFTEAEITRDTFNQGHRLANVPRHSGSLWATYQVIPARFEVGGGAIVVSQREGDNDNTFQMPGYVRADAFVAYHWKLRGSRLTAQLNVNNLLDKRYFKGTDTLNGFPRSQVHPGEPLTVLGAARLEF